MFKCRVNLKSYAKNAFFCKIQDGGQNGRQKYDGTKFHLGNNRIL